MNASFDGKELFDNVRGLGTSDQEIVVSGVIIAPTEFDAMDQLDAIRAYLGATRRLQGLLSDRSWTAELHSVNSGRPMRNTLPTCYVIAYTARFWVRETHEEPESEPVKQETWRDRPAML